jgi:hypothetical protein
VLRINVTRFDADPDSAFHFDADLDRVPDPSFQIKAQNLEKVLTWAHIPYILACHLDCTHST